MEKNTYGYQAGTYSMNIAEDMMNGSSNTGMNGMNGSTMNPGMNGMNGNGMNMGMNGMGAGMNTMNENTINPGMNVMNGNGMDSGMDNITNGNNWNANMNDMNRNNRNTGIAFIDDNTVGSEINNGTNAMYPFNSESMEQGMIDDATYNRNSRQLNGRYRMEQCQNQENCQQAGTAAAPAAGTMDQRIFDFTGGNAGPIVIPPLPVDPGFGITPPIGDLTNTGIPAVYVRDVSYNAMQNIVNSLVYVWLLNGETCWMYPTSVDNEMIDGYRYNSPRSGWFNYSMPYDRVFAILKIQNRESIMPL